MSPIFPISSFTYLTQAAGSIVVTGDIITNAYNIKNSYSSHDKKILFLSQLTNYSS